jgi:thioredoxin
MPLVELTNENFDSQVDRYPIMILDFWAAWCAPCKAFAPVFEAAAQKYPDICFAKVNTDLEPTLAKQFEVRSIPTLLAAKNGTIVKVQVGALTPDKLEKLIQELR